MICNVFMDRNCSTFMLMNCATEWNPKVPSSIPQQKLSPADEWLAWLHERGSGTNAWTSASAAPRLVCLNKLCWVGMGDYTPTPLAPNNNKARGAGPAVKIHCSGLYKAKIYVYICPYITLMLVSSMKKLTQKKVSKKAFKTDSLQCYINSFT